jgi:hypothetical protein
VFSGIASDLGTIFRHVHVAPALGDNQELPRVAEDMQQLRFGLASRQIAS